MMTLYDTNRLASWIQRAVNVHVLFLSMQIEIKLCSCVLIKLTRPAGKTFLYNVLMYTFFSVTIVSKYLQILHRGWLEICRSFWHLSATSVRRIIVNSKTNQVSCVKASPGTDSRGLCPRYRESLGICWYGGQKVHPDSMESFSRLWVDRSHVDRRGSKGWILKRSSCSHNITINSYPEGKTDPSSTAISSYVIIECSQFPLTHDIYKIHQNSTSRYLSLMISWCHSVGDPLPGLARVRPTVLGAAGNSADRKSVV